MWIFWLFLLIFNSKKMCWQYSHGIMEWFTSNTRFIYPLVIWSTYAMKCRGLKISYRMQNRDSKIEIKTKTANSLALTCSCVLTCTAQVNIQVRWCLTLPQYPGVPQTVIVFSSLWSIFDNPKSAIFKAAFSLWSRYKRFSG